MISNKSLEIHLMLFPSKIDLILVLCILFLFSILNEFPEIGPMFNSSGGARKGGSDSRNRIVEE